MHVPELGVHRAAQVLRCNFAQPMKIKGGEAGFATQPGA